MGCILAILGSTVMVIHAPKEESVSQIKRGAYFLWSSRSHAEFGANYHRKDSPRIIYSISSKNVSR